MHTKNDTICGVPVYRQADDVRPIKFRKSSVPEMFLVTKPHFRFFAGREPDNQNDVIDVPCAFLVHGGLVGPSVGPPLQKRDLRSRTNIHSGVGNKTVILPIWGFDNQTCRLMGSAEKRHDMVQNTKSTINFEWKCCDQVGGQAPDLVVVAYLGVYQQIFNFSFLFLIQNGNIQNLSWFSAMSQHFQGPR